MNDVIHGGHLLHVVKHLNVYELALLNWNKSNNNNNNISQVLTLANSNMYVHACLGACMCFASEQRFPASQTGSATLATWRKYRKYKLSASNSSIFLRQHDGARARKTENNEQHTQPHQKDTNVQTGGLESHRWLDTDKRSIMKLKTEKASMADMGEYTHTVSAETVAAGMSLLPCSNNKSSVLIQYINRNDPSLTCIFRKSKVSSFNGNFEWNDHLNHGSLFVPGSSFAVFCIKRHNHYHLWVGIFNFQLIEANVTHLTSDKSHLIG